VRAEAPAAAIYSFVPAGGAAGARNHSRNAVMQLAEAMRAHLAAEGDGRAVLLADFSSAQMAGASCITCLDLTDANPVQARESIGVSEAVFVVSASDPASIEDARAHAAWLRYILRSFRREEACGLLLVPAAQGLTADEAEVSVGLPVCGVFKTQNHIAQLARWIIQE